jgi:hypothetical protein
VIEVPQVQAAEHRVVLREPSFQRHRQVRDLDPHPAQGQVRQDGAAPLAVDQRLDYRLPGLGGDGRGDRVQLDPGVLQQDLLRMGRVLGSFTPTAEVRHGGVSAVKRIAH